jgi:hypothetical protein
MRHTLRLQTAVSDRNDAYEGAVTANPNLVGGVRKLSFRYERTGSIIA